MVHPAADGLGGTGGGGAVAPAVDGRGEGGATVRWCERWAAGAAGRGEEERVAELLVCSL